MPGYGNKYFENIVLFLKVKSDENYVRGVFIYIKK
jgi:hypothetical protein